jgi:LDH2 family malate/lactate/ureidoglycolate dehydrogenase
VDNFQPVEEFTREMDRVIREIRDSKRMENVDRIWLPGEIEYRRMQERREKGIPLAGAVVQKLQELAAELKLADRLE